jgi:hypothetical protein
MPYRRLSRYPCRDPPSRFFFGTTGGRHAHRLLERLEHRRSHHQPEHFADPQLHHRLHHLSRISYRRLVLQIVSPSRRGPAP